LFALSLIQLENYRLAMMALYFCFCENVTSLEPTGSLLYSWMKVFEQLH